ncbi:MAG: hypothetical protein OEY39_06345 [Candidatus Bathyarchaeota archaeon]|nr:hypothetical protein [Candidatus Bathyarchaeota archaeon]
MNWLQLSPIRVWFTTLLLLNILDIATTSPLYEANPVTLYIWGQIGIFLSAWVKIGLVLLFGALCVAAKKVVAPHEWKFTSQVFKAMLIVLVAYYAFVVIMNIVVILSTMGG